MQRFLQALPKENWTNAYFPGTKYGEMCSNVAESFNAWIEEQRFLPIYKLVDGIRVKIMKMNARRRLEAERWTYRTGLALVASGELRVFLVHMP